jgi:RNA polymerase sigma factor (sigma-70 family)
MENEETTLFKAYRKARDAYVAELSNLDFAADEIASWEASGEKLSTLFYTHDKEGDFSIRFSIQQNELRALMRAFGDSSRALPPPAIIAALPFRRKALARLDRKLSALIAEEKHKETLLREPTTPDEKKEIQRRRNLIRFTLFPLRCAEGKVRAARLRLQRAEAAILETMQPMIESRVDYVLVSLPACAERDDVRQGVLMALGEQIDAFDPTYGASFREYTKQFQSNRGVFEAWKSLPGLKVSLGRIKELNSLARTACIPSDPNAVAHTLCVSPRVARDVYLLSLLQPYTPLPLSSSIEDTKAPSAEEYVQASQLRRLFKDSLADLKPRHRAILIDRYGLDGNEPMTYEEIGVLFHVTRARVQQICQKAENRKSWRALEKLVLG